MFESLVKDYTLKKAPATVIPVGVSIKDAMDKYNLDHVYKLASNENPFGVSPKALDAMTEALKTGHLYPDSTRDTVLRNKLAAFHGVGSDQIMVTCGAANAIAYACETFISEGTECIVPSPAYPPYFFNVFKNGGVIIDIPSRKSDMKIDLEAISAAINEKTRFIFLCNPNNPTGTAWKADEVEAFLRKIPSNVIILVDEAYIDFTDDPKVYSLSKFLSDYPNMIVVRTFSKIYGLAAIRVGYAVACPEIIKYM
ncbi:MAG: aminotransferase class I/II-fold pyridoxal phosphate-dependent enzyme, partial [Sphaerochaetaceae bacterium]|nr:aminotransferase class I/II-fold pyridoxal phosphate-dependent enzyme [Sphaerochaetaceae bacterium]